MGGTAIVEPGDRERPAASRTAGAQPAELRRAALTAAVALLGLNVADVVLTRLLLARGAVERNPVAERLLATDTALVVKLLVVAALLARLARRGADVVTLCLLWLATGIYVCVVVLNGSALAGT